MFANMAGRVEWGGAGIVVGGVAGVMMLLA